MRNRAQGTEGVLLYWPARLSLGSSMMCAPHAHEALTVAVARFGTCRPLVLSYRSYAVPRQSFDAPLWHFRDSRDALAESCISRRTMCNVV